MEKIQLILLLAGSLIVLCVIFFSIKKQSMKKIQDDYDYFVGNDEDNVTSFINEDLQEQKLYKDNVIEKTPRELKSKQSSIEDNGFMAVSVHAKPGKVFSDYGFLQSMGAAGLVYGDHNIFHYDVKTDVGIHRLFSVAQLNNPGTFDLNHVENLACKGLLMFINLNTCRKQTLALDCMLESAYQLAEDLDGIMFESYNIPWREDTPKALAQRLEQYQIGVASVLDEVTY